MEKSDSQSSSSSSIDQIFSEVLQDFRKQALDFYGHEDSETQLSKDVEKCLVKKASAYVSNSPLKLFLFPCINDLSNVQDDDEDPQVEQRSRSSSSFIARPSRISRSRFGSESCSSINDFNSILSSKQDNHTLLFHKNQE